MISAGHIFFATKYLPSLSRGSLLSFFLCVLATIISCFALWPHITLISSEKWSHDNISANCEHWDTKSAKLCGHYRGPWDILHGWHNLERGGVNVDNLFVLANTRSTARLPVGWFAWIHWFLRPTDPRRLLQTVKLDNITTSEQTNMYLFSGITPSNIINRYIFTQWTHSRFQSQCGVIWFGIWNMNNEDLKCSYT